MGAQDEYLRNFCILLTDKGVVPLTDPLQIAVFNSLQGGMKRPSDLTTELKLSSSSLHFVIDKMSESGIITRIKPETDKKMVYYSTSAILLASSSETNDQLREASQKTFVDPLKNYRGLSSLANMLDCYTSEIGLDVEPLKARYANSLAASIDMNKNGMEEALMDTRDVFARLTGFNFTVFSFSPLTLVVSGDDTVMEKSSMLMQFVIGLIENSTGRTYKVISTESFNGSETMIKVTMDRAEKPQEPYINLSLHHKDPARFLMVDLDGTAGLMTSDVQIDIIDAIYERPLCITDIVEKVDSPRSTITSNLLRMVEEGVISVFYSESGSAYYGLACSILLKKSRAMSDDSEELRNTLDSIKSKDGAFMEGYLLYTLSYLKKLGFDSEYLMVVLGAKYMRATGSMEVQGNFDTYFGKMSDIAKAIGLSLNIVSVYPLTIGISSTDPDSEMSQAMTFITGMAHQGLEMASSGIFVRSTEAKENDENVSFKEIYPALSMTPVKGVMVENLAPAPATKKRTSSVKTALLNRSKKESGKPARTVRYITAIAFMMLLVAVVVFAGFSDNTEVVDAETFSLTLEDDLGIEVYDSEGNAMSYPYDVVSGAVLSLSIAETKDIGYVKDGVAFRLIPESDGRYNVTMTSDLFLEELFDVSEIEEINCSFSLYCSVKAIVDDSSVVLLESDAYKAISGGLYVTKNNRINFVADNGYYIESAGPNSSERLLQTFMCDSTSFKSINVKALPNQTKKIDLGDDCYYYGDQIVTGEIILDKDTASVELRYAGDKNVVIRMNGAPVELDHDNCFTVSVPPIGEMVLTSEETGLY